VGYQYTLSTGETFYCQSKREMTIGLLLERVGFRRDDDSRDIFDDLVFPEGTGLYYQQIDIYPGTKKYKIFPDSELYPKEYEEQYRRFYNENS
jgi:hypothetical protein